MGSKEEVEEVMLPNKQVILKAHINRPPRDSDPEIRTFTVIRLKAPLGSKAILVKNLYPSVNPYQAILVQKIYVSTFTFFEPGLASTYALTTLVGGRSRQAAPSQHEDEMQASPVWNDLDVPLYDLVMAIFNRVKIEGFAAFDIYDRYSKFLEFVLSNRSANRS